MTTFTYPQRALVCEQHFDFISGKTGKVTISAAMISSDRGLICPICYSDKVRWATEEEAAPLLEAQARWAEGRGK